MLCLKYTQKPLIAVSISRRHLRVSLLSRSFSALCCNFISLRARFFIITYNLSSSSSTAIILQFLSPPSHCSIKIMLMVICEVKIKKCWAREKSINCRLHKHLCRVKLNFMILFNEFFCLSSFHIHASCMSFILLTMKFDMLS